MPRIVDYEIVLARMQSEGFTCVYHNSGAFEFASGDVKTIGWIGPDDPTIREAARQFTQRIPLPYERNLADLLVHAWTQILSGVVWVMPLSHWAYELDFGGREWLEAALREISIDPAQLAPRTNGSAIEFDVTETENLRTFSMRLLENLKSSDFSLAFPGRATICTLHHHKQIWWQTTDEPIGARLDNLFSPSSPAEGTRGVNAADQRIS